MPDVAFPGSSDRLPWLPNDFSSAKPAISRARQLGAWAVVGFLLVASGSYWLGTRSREGASGVSTGSTASTVAKATVRSLEFSSSQPRPQTAPAPTAQSAPSSEQTAARPEVVKVIHEYIRLPSGTNRDNAAKTQPEQAPAVASPQPEAPIAPRIPAPQPLTLWPSRQVAGANGPLVQIGAFASPLQAKLGWRHMQREYPAIGQLPAVVIPTRNSKGRKFYRFQIGTTSQAHSEVLCQRMEMIHFSCAVIGLPWKEKVER